MRGRTIVSTEKFIQECTKSVKSGLTLSQFAEKMVSFGLTKNGAINRYYTYQNLLKKEIKSAKTIRKSKYQKSLNKITFTRRVYQKRKSVLDIILKVTKD